MKNYEKLLKNISSWLKPEGLLFIHIFLHKSIPYHFEVCLQDVVSSYFSVLPDSEYCGEQRLAEGVAIGYRVPKPSGTYSLCFVQNVHHFYMTEIGCSGFSTLTSRILFYEFP